MNESGANRQVPSKERMVARFGLDKQLNEPAYENPLFKQIMPENFALDYYYEDGLCTPLVFNCDPNELGMRMVDDNIDFKDVARLVGGNRTVLVASEENKDGDWMRMDLLADKMQIPPDQRENLINCISAEVSHTALADHILSPDLVRKIDWARCWPDSMKTSQVDFNDDGSYSFEPDYPCVQYFCLITAGGYYTNFHVDFHGSTVWYHVKKGKKVFWIVKPTENNLKAYEKWEKNEKDDTRFFGEVAEENTCCRVVLEEGNTFILPSGWIHSVYTPVDSLAFGGNFLHTRAASMQLRIKKQERIIAIDKANRYPKEDEALLYYLSYLAEKITGRFYVRPSSRADPSFEGIYVGKAFHESDRHKWNVKARDFDNGGKARAPLGEDQVFEKYAASQVETENKPYTGDEEFDEELMDDYFWNERTFFHPSTFDMDKPKIDGTVEMAKAVSLNEPLLRINEVALRKHIHRSEVAELRVLINHLRKMKSIAIPQGLTKPNSLIACLEELLSVREAMKDDEEDDTMEEEEEERVDEMPFAPLDGHPNWNRTESDEELRMMGMDDAIPAAPRRKRARREEEEEEEEGMEEDCGMNDNGENREEEEDGEGEDEEGEESGEGEPEAAGPSTSTMTPREKCNAMTYGFHAWLRVHKAYLVHKYPAAMYQARRSRARKDIFNHLPIDERNFWMNHVINDCACLPNHAAIDSNKCSCHSSTCKLKLDD